MNLLPGLSSRGSLHIGIQAASLPGTLSLLFHLADDSEPNGSKGGAATTWSLLGAHGWSGLEADAVLSDSTAGFMKSGVVVLQLPQQIEMGGCLMPSGLYWLRIEADGGFDRFCSLYSVHSQAIEVRWSPEANPRPRARKVLPAGSITSSGKPLPGVVAIEQICDSQGGQDPETLERFRARIGERLRHKGRAMCALDYEQLVLENFPEVGKVKAFANLRMGVADRRFPGEVLVVPLPLDPGSGLGSPPPRMKGHLLQEIGRFLKNIAPEFARIDVANPQFDEILVSCTISLRPGLRADGRSQQLDQALWEFLSPWRPGGNTRHFGWCIRQQEVEAFLRGFDFVEQVGGFSMLRISPEDAPRHSLLDTARQESAGGDVVISPRYPWSVAVGSKYNLLTIVDRMGSEMPRKVGVGKLRIGSTFIVSGPGGSRESAHG